MRGLEGCPAGRAERQRPDELAAADVVVIPSVEPGPLVLAEALVLCRPVVAAPVGLVPEVMREGSAAGSCPSATRALAASVAALLADPVAAQRMAEPVGRPSTRCGAGALVEATEELYRDLLGPSCAVPRCRLRPAGRRGRGARRAGTGAAAAGVAAGAGGLPAAAEPREGAHRLDAPLAAGGPDRRPAPRP